MFHLTFLWVIKRVFVFSHEQFSIWLKSDESFSKRVRWNLEHVDVELKVLSELRTVLLQVLNSNTHAFLLLTHDKEFWELTCGSTTEMHGQLTCSFSNKRKKSIWLELMKMQILKTNIWYATMIIYLEKWFFVQSFF